MTAEEIRAKFFTFINKATSCWIWTGTLTPNGYGYMYTGLNEARKHLHISAHRFSWELVNGPIPVGLVIDHICRVKTCVNPSHLRAVTTRENILCGISVPAINSRKKLCLRGHALFVRADGYRECKVCKAMKQQRRREQKRGGRPLRFTRLQPVRQMSGGQIVAEFESVAVASQRLGVARSGISNCLTGRAKTAGGFVWEYAK